MTLVALSHGYPPEWNMGGEVSLHRTIREARGDKIVLTETKRDYTLDGVFVSSLNTPDVLDMNADPEPIASQIKSFGANVVVGQNEISLPAVRAAKIVGAKSIVSVHTPPKYGGRIKSAVLEADYSIFNTYAAASGWGQPEALVVHPPTGDLPEEVYKNTGDAYTMLSSLTNKGVSVVLSLAKRHPRKRFIIVRSPAEPTHGLPDLEERAAMLPNVELHPRVAPEEVHKYLEQTRILLVPSRYETYGMSAIEAAGYGIPSIHVDTPHVREGIGKAAVLIPPLSLSSALNGIRIIEDNYENYREKSRSRAEWLSKRQAEELERFSDFIDSISK
jgi:hypothetical protein